MVQAATVSNIELPARMKDMEQNATDDGLSLKRLFFRMVLQAVSHGRVPTVINIDDQGQPYFATYRASNATNWKEATVDGRQHPKQVR